jgi:thioredoxin-related protein
MKTNLASVLLLSFLISLCSLYSFGDEEYRPTLIVFSADWCGHCQNAKRDLNNHKELSETVKQYHVVTANYDVDKDLVEGYNIKTIPTFVVIKGNKVTKKVGYNGPKDLNQFLK